MVYKFQIKVLKNPFLGQTISDIQSKLMDNEIQNGNINADSVLYSIVTKQSISLLYRSFSTKIHLRIIFFCLTQSH